VTTERAVEIDEAHRWWAMRRLYFDAAVAKRRRATAAPGHQRNDVHVEVAPRRGNAAIVVKPSTLGVVVVHEPSYGGPIPLRVRRKAPPPQQTPAYCKVVQSHVVVDRAASCERRRRGHRETRDVAADATNRHHGTNVGNVGRQNHARAACNFAPIFF